MKTLEEILILDPEWLEQMGGTNQLPSRLVTQFCLIYYVCLLIKAYYKAC